PHPLACTPLCDPCDQGKNIMPHSHPLTRREVAQLAAAGFVGGSVSGWFGQFAEQAAAAEKLRKPKSCILLWMDGGPSHIDTFDPKPDAVADVHGGIKAIETAVSGIQITEKLPEFAKLMSHAAILRGM